MGTTDEPEGVVQDDDRELRVPMLVSTYLLRQLLGPEIVDTALKRCEHLPRDARREVVSAYLEVPFLAKLGAMITQGRLESLLFPLLGDLTAPAQAPTALIIEIGGDPGSMAVRGLGDQDGPSNGH